MCSCTTFVALSIVVLACILLNQGNTSIKRMPKEFLFEGTQVQLSSGETRYRIYGEENFSSPKGLLVCIHGFSTPSYIVWNTFALKAEKERYVVLTYDLYGRGGSEAPYLPNTPSLFSSQLFELLNNLYELNEIPSNIHTTVIGLSMGGAIATHFTSTFPLYVDSLFLLAPAGLGAPIPWFTPILSIPYFDDFIGPHIAPIALKKQLLSMYKYNDENWEGKESQEIFASNVFDSLSTLFETHPGFVPSLLSTLRDFPLTDMRDTFTKIPNNIPVHFIWGDIDTICPLPSKKTLKTLVPNSKLHILKNANHDFISSRIESTSKIIFTELQNERDIHIK